MSGRAACSLVILVLSAGSVRPVRANSFVTGLGFEAAGVAGSVSPDDWNQIFQQFGLGTIDRTYGFAVGISEQLSPSWRLAVRSGYLTGSTSTGTVTITNEMGQMVATTEYDYVVESIPLLFAGDYRIGPESVALVLSLAGGVNFADVTLRLHEDPAENYAGEEYSWGATFTDLNGAVGVEWRPLSHFLMGLKGGYRASSGDIPVDEGQSTDVELDLNGVYIALYVLVQPWISDH